MVQEHNKVSADVWSRGGLGYDVISFCVSDALGQAVQALWPQSDEKILDVATGTGWCARNIASLGANVTAIDIASDLLAAAESRSAHIEPAIQYKRADAEKLPFKDGEFDGIISTFGVMFAGNHDAAASELARVCRPAGRLVLATWAPGPDSLVARMFALVAKHAGAPPPAQSPIDWGKPDYLQKLLGQEYDIEVENGASISYAPDGQEIWRVFYEGFGPVRMLADRLSPDKLTSFKDDFIGLHEEYRSGNRLKIERSCVFVFGTRK